MGKENYILLAGDISESRHWNSTWVGKDSFCLVDLRFPPLVRKFSAGMPARQESGGRN